jgi:hypothetical protein
MSANPGKIHLDIAKILKASKGGLSSGEMRRELQDRGYAPGEQAHADRRMRDLKQWWEITKRRDGSVVRYSIGKRRKTPHVRGVSLRNRAIVLRRGLCAMCGLSVARDGIKLVVDHKQPHEWGGSDELDNLQPLCEECNAGKKALFSSLDDDLMREVLRYESVHHRIARTLQLQKGKAVPSEMLGIIANQEDWQKRLRELRYLGWVIVPRKRKLASGRVTSAYILKHEGQWRDDMTQHIRRYERKRSQANRGRPLIG